MNASIHYVLKQPPRELLVALPRDIEIPPRPVHLPASLYVPLMDPKVPLSIAVIYTCTVSMLNYTRTSKAKATPWRVAQLRAFHQFVVLHNVFLCCYSFWTLRGMGMALHKTLRDNMAELKAAGLPAAVGFLKGSCHMEAGLWENGLGYYGFLFYLSKMYEFIDTFIILAKGKRSSILQTYHHAGALLSVYIGVRFRSPPIVYFILFNSFIHTLMVRNFDDTR